MGRRRRTQVVRSAGGAVVRVVEGAPHVLLIRDPYEKWGLPKGHAESGETGLTELELGSELLTIDWKFRAQGGEIHKFATFYLMFSERGDPVPERAGGITRAEWVRLDSAHERVSYPNAIAVVLAAQEAPLDETAKKSQTQAHE